MKLNEWKDSKGNKVSSTPVQKSGTSTGFKNRFTKLLDYAKNHTGPEVVKTSIKSVSDDGFFYTETRKGKHFFYDVDITVYIGQQTEAWRLKVYKNNNLEDDLVGQVWGELLKTLRNYIAVPVVSTPEYSDLFTESLTEWTDSKGNKVNTTSSQPTGKLSNRDKFIELTDYLKAHANSHTVKADVTRLDDSGFTYKEVRSIPNVNDITLVVVCNHSRFSNAWSCEFYRNQKLIEDTLGHGWTDLLKLLDSYFNAPTVKDPIYKKLTESASYSTIDDFKNYETMWNDLRE